MINEESSKAELLQSSKCALQEILLKLFLRLLEKKALNIWQHEAQAQGGH